MNYRRLIILLLTLFGGLQGLSATQVSSGRLDKFEPFKSAYFDDKNVYIWVPEGYSKDKKYAVLYMHDAQNLFDAKSTWNKQEWGIDETGTRLMAQGRVKDFIVVSANNGNHNGKQERMDQYFPQKVFNDLPASYQQKLLKQQRDDALLFAGNIQSDDYLKFLVSELKPFVDKHYSVLTDRDNTFVMGSSMGGLISLYAISEYPEIFGGAGCLSTHWPGATPDPHSPVPDAFIRYMRENLPDPLTHRIYFDLGTETLDSYYPPLQARADRVMLEKGYSYRNWISNTFVGDKHEETYWQKRLHIPLLFLLGK